MAFHQSLDLHVLIGCNKYGYHVRIISQRVVSTASDNYAGFLVRKVLIVSNCARKILWLIGISIYAEFVYPREYVSITREYKKLLVGFSSWVSNSSFPAFAYFHIFKSDKMDRVISVSFSPVACFSR